MEAGGGLELMLILMVIAVMSMEAGMRPRVDSGAVATAW